MATLATATAAAIGPSGGLRIGVISATGGRIVVDIAGAAVTTAGRLASYQPAKGDTVAILRQESTWLILGRIVTGA